MMKPCRGENPDLKIELNATWIFVFIFFLSQKVLPQVPINGFCKYQQTTIPSGLSSLIALNYNNDSYTDLMLYNSDSKKIYSIPGKSNGSFGNPIANFFPYQISSIQNLNEKNQILKRYAFTSRKSMRAGIISFSLSGIPYVSASIKFNSYPENISTADIDQSGKDAMLISGSAFNGLSVVYQSKSGLKNKKIIQQTSFSQAIFADLSNDGFSDIAAFNVLNNSLMFFYNDGTGKFNMVRSFIMDQPIHSLKATDMNLDNYTDLLFVKGKSIVIMYGDFASSYSKVVTIPTKYFPDEIITGDFNRDGKIDIAYVNKEAGILSVIFAKDEYSFYPETIYLKKNGLKSIIPYYSKFVNAIAALSDSGKIYSISNLASIISNTSIITSAKPIAINYFDHSNNGIIDICYIDSLTTSLDLVIRNNAGIPAFLFTLPLNQIHDKILVDNSKPKVKTFYCFSLGGRLIEIIKINFDRNKVETNSIYSPGKILDLKVYKNDNNDDNIYVAYSKNGRLGLSIFEYHNYRFTSINYNNIANDVWNASISFGKFPVLFYWARIGNLLNLYSATFFSKIENIYNNVSLPAADTGKVVLYTGDFLNKDDESAISFYPVNKKSAAVVYYSTKNVIWESKNIPGYFYVNNENQLFYGQIRFSNLKKLCAYLPNSNMIVKLDFINRGKEFIVSKLAETKNIGSYFIKNMSFSSYHLVYINQGTDCIEIEKL